MAFIYILKSEKTGQYYIGSTNELERRLLEHNRGQTSSTASGRPWLCVFSQVVESSKKAQCIESRLKRWKNKKILDQIVADGYLRV